MKIDGKEYTLSPRLASDVIELNASRGKREPDGTLNVLIVAQALCDSLKATGRKLSFLQSIPYRKFSAKGKAAIWLTEHMSVQELTDAWEELDEIEGGKKKVQEAVKE